jgi:predicted phosphodiesterase
MFDFVSDLHVDTYFKSKKDCEKFIQKILPEEPSEVLIIAGDISTRAGNTVPSMFLMHIAQFYKEVLVVLGNHDYWTNTLDTYKGSFDRVSNLKNRFVGTNVSFLDGTTKTINGVTYGGTVGWYDGSYGVLELGLTESYIDSIHKNFSDYQHVDFDYREFCRTQKEILKELVKVSDVVITHHIPIWEKIPLKYATDPYSSFFHFDGYDLVRSCKDKVWIFGHTHDSYDYNFEGCQMLCNPLGYLHEKFLPSHFEDSKKFPVRIRTY